MAMPLFDFLIERQETIAKSWCRAVLSIWPEDSARFMLEKKDPFQNPMGSTVQTCLPKLLEAVLNDTLDSEESGKAAGELANLLAVKDAPPSEVFSFLPAFRRIFRDNTDEREEDITSETQREESELQARLDRLTLLFFDRYMACRERLYSIRAEEAKRSVYLLKRMHPLPEDEQVRDEEDKDSRRDVPRS